MVHPVTLTKRLFLQNKRGTATDLTAAKGYLQQEAEEVMNLTILPKTRVVTLRRHAPVITTDKVVLTQEKA